MFKIDVYGSEIIGQSLYLFRNENEVERLKVGSKSNFL